MKKCPCCSNRSFAECCEPFLVGKKIPDTPEELMRSRYSAYATGQIDYIEQTMKREALEGFDKKEALNWSKAIKWLNLRVTNSSLQPPTKGFVTFEARYIESNYLCHLTEVSEFEHIKDRWFYTRGKPQTSHKEISLNQRCPCGSNKKYKRCCIKS